MLSCDLKVELPAFGKLNLSFSTPCWIRVRFYNFFHVLIFQKCLIFVMWEFDAQPMYTPGVLGSLINTILLFIPKKGYNK